MSLPRASVEAILDPVRPMDRRAAVRYSCRSAARLQFPQAFAHEVCITATARDISSGGISLVCSQWFGPGTLLRIELTNTATGVCRVVGACVMHSTLLRDGSWFLGCALDDRLRPEELVEFI